MKISNSYYGEKSKFELIEQIVNAHKNVIVFYDSLYDRSMIERFFENKDVDVNRFPFAELESDRSVYLVPKTCTSGWKSDISNTVVFYNTFAEELMEEAKEIVSENKTGDAYFYYLY